MVNQATFTKRTAKSGAGLLVWIPKDVAGLLRLSESDIVEITLKKLGRGETGS